MARTFDRRSFLGRSMTVAAGVVAAGAVGEVLTELPAAARTNGRGRNGVSKAKPKRGGKLIFGVDAEEQGFNPTTARFDEVGVMYARTVFDPLAIVTTKGTVAPYLAQSITPNPEYTQWTVTLRPNLVFHDGTPCDAQALYTNFEEHYKALLTGLVLDPIVDSFTVSGPLSVQVNLKSPWVPFPYYLTGGIGGQLAYVAAPSMLNAPNGGTTKPVGTGPFVFQVWHPNDHFTATRNPHYWRSGYPYLDSITYRPIPDADARSEALQSGTIDIMITDTPQEVVKFRGNRSWSYVDDSGPVIGEPDMNCIMLNLGAAPFDNASARLAAAKALSSKAYSKAIDIGVNPPSSGLFVPGTPYYSKVPYPAYDPSAAKKLVKEVEKRTGKPVSFTLGSTSDPQTVRAAQYLQQRFQSVGMKVQLASFQQNELINNALVGKFQAYVWRQFAAVNPDLNYIYWSTSTLGKEGSLSINMARNDDPEVEHALQLGRTTTNPQIRAKAYQTVNERFAKDLPYLWNDRAVWAVVAKPSVQNFNNPTTPSGQSAKGLIAGSIWPTQIWLQ